jgi:hypothetical protein
MLQIPVSTWQIDQVEDCGNGYGWSIIYLQGQEVYELAVLKNGKICYHTDITDDVVRGTWSTMSYYIQEIKCL